jgi:hypothetical protein
MSRNRLDRRQFLVLPLALTLAPLEAALGARGSRRTGYAVDIAILYGAFTFRLIGTLEEIIDRIAGRYEVRGAGEGRGIANRLESVGTLARGRWVPLRSRSWVQVAGRETTTEIVYDHDRGAAEYRMRGETFFGRRLRVVEDVVPLPAAPIDDLSSALLNYGERRWLPSQAGVYRTHVLLRRRSTREGPEGVDTVYRAEVVPLAFEVKPDRETGKSTASLDLTRLSSWAREDEPALIVFAPDGRPERITSSLALGSSIAIQMTSPA